MTTISLCMIVKNEESNLQRCLQSVKDYVEEIVIVDTGSTDKTKSIAESFGAKIYDFIWTDDFAAARNFSLEQSSGDWILWMDADEELCISDFEFLQELMRQEQQDLIAVPMVHYYGSNPADDAHSHLSTSYRLFRGKKGIKFTGSIHEHLELRHMDLPTANENNPLKILHYGYMDQELIAKKKGNRNMRLLLQEQLKNTQDPWLHYHIACEHCREENFFEAFNECNMSIKMFLENEILPPSLVYKLKYDILIKTGNAQSAWPGIEKAIELYPDYVDLRYYMGIILLANKEYNMAIDAFNYCLSLKEDNPKYLILRGTGSFLALYYLGVCYQAIQQDTLAVEAYTKSLVLNPLFKEAKTKLASLAEKSAL